MKITSEVTKVEANNDIDYIKSIGLLALDPDVEWRLKFICPPNCKWSEDAPNRWKILSSGTFPIISIQMGFSCNIWLISDTPKNLLKLFIVSTFGKSLSGLNLNLKVI